jgi:hypothetical protein
MSIGLSNPPATGLQTKADGSGNDGNGVSVDEGGSAGGGVGASVLSLPMTSVVGAGADVAGGAARSEQARSRGVKKSGSRRKSVSSRRCALYLGAEES